LNSARITLVQATRKLSEMLEKMGDARDDDLSGLSFEEFDKVRLALTSQHNLIRLKARHSGMLLYPPKSNGESATRLKTGSAVKADQVLALMGDLTGVTVEINIPEVDITEIKPGMPATIHGVAFGKQALHGKLVTLNAQASSVNGSALPSFTAIVEVKSLTRAQQKLVKVGMSASIELSSDSNDKLMIPLSAIKQKNGKSVVEIIIPHGKTRQQLVITGSVHGNRVVILSGLKEGDIVKLWH
jgi:multidrug efflux pump subunit AcrA (membrane-fusion protein)